MWQAFRSWLDANRAVLGIDTAELAAPSLGSYENGRLVHIYADRVVNGVPVRASFVSGTLNSGNLVLYGTQHWGSIDTTTTPNVSSEQARGTVASHLSGFTVTAWGRPELVIVPLANGDASAANEGRGLRYRLAWAVAPQVQGSGGSWEGLVDAHSGELIAFYDRNSYFDHKKVIGGIFPVSNDGQSPGGIPDGVEQPGFPMSHAYVFDSQGNQLTANSEGLVQVDGQYSTELTGPFLRIVDNCGAIEESAVCPALDLGTSRGTDCEVPIGHSAGDTHSARTGFYEVNRLIDQAKSWIGPAAAANLWMNRQLPANMNINNSCNAFFSPADTTSPTTGSINFYREVSASPNSGLCRNTGEIAAVFDHEWGHGLDTFDDSPGVSVPGEAYADMAAIMRLNTSCIGRGFFTSGFCGGNGDPCTECSGVREADWKKRQSGRPHDLSWVLGQNPTVPGSCPVTAPPATPFNSGPCQRSTHCEGSIITEAVWDLLKRDLPCHTKRWESFAGGSVAGGRCTAGQPSFMDERSALVLGTRLFYLAAGGVTSGYQCDVALGGCVAGSWYLQILAADDDNGSALDGTPHMVAINDAFIRHGIGCGVPLATNAGCTATPAPTATTVVTATAAVQSATINWTPVAGAAEYWVLRTDGVHGCGFGKTRVARIAATAPLTFTQNDLLDGLTYYYSVVAVGGALGVPRDSCAGPMSDCASVTPLAPSATTGPGAAVEQTDDAVVEPGGDNDPFVDNCESARLTFNVVNTGGVTLTGVQVTSITPSSAATQILTPLPIAVPDLGSGCGGSNSTAPVTFRFRAGGQPPQSTLTFNVTIDANEIGPVTGTLTVHDTETDLTMGDVTFTFEPGTEGWTTFSGTFDRTNLPPPGAEGTAFYMKSSSALNDACDRSRSPKVRLTASSTLSLFNQFLTEPEVDPANGLPFYDRGNVGIVNEAGQTAIVSPNGGRLYNALNTYTGCNNGPGWATSVSQPINTWAQSSWSAAALGAASYAGQEVQIEVAYGTDALNANVGFQFDQVRLTNVLIAGPDQQSNVCQTPTNQPPDAVDDSASTQLNTPVTINVVANDSDPDGNTFTVTSVSDPPHGTAVNNANGTVTYTPDTGFVGNDSFTYTICDNGTPSLCDTATVTVSVNCPATATGSFSDDFEPAPEPGWTKNTAVNNNTGFNWSVVIDPMTHSPTNAYASDAAGLDLKDDRLIAPPQNLSPTSQLSFWHRFLFEETFDGGVLEVSTDGGATWVDVGAASFVTGGYNGVIAPAFDSPIAGRPAWTGPSTFINAMNQVVVNLGAFAGPARLIRWRLAQDPFTIGAIPGTAWWIDDVLITQTLQNQSQCPLPPNAVDDSAATDKNTPVTINVLANDNDPNGDPMTVQSVSDPPNGTAVNNGNGTVTYTPDTNFVGNDTFTYQACDPGNLCDTATVTVTVRDVNRAPVANDDMGATFRDTPTTINVVANDTDPDGDTLSVTSVTDPPNGTAVNNGNGTVTYTPDSGFIGTDNFNYTVCDNRTPPLCDSAQVTVTVREREPGQTGDPVFLIIDEDSIDNGNPPNNFSATDVNDQIAALARRTELAFFNARAGQDIILWTGQVGDEGWFAFKTVPPAWNSAGPTPSGLRNFIGNPSQPYPHNVGPGLGTGNDPEKLLDKIRNVTPLRADGLKMLEGRRVCAVVFDSDISINYGPLSGSLKGANLGTVAFEVRSVTRLTGQSSSSLPKVVVRILDSETVCEGPLQLFTTAPAPSSSSEPHDVDP